MDASRPRQPALFPAIDGGQSAFARAALTQSALLTPNGHIPPCEALIYSALLATRKPLAARYSTMSKAPSDTSRSFRSEPARTSINLVASASQAAHMRCRGTAGGIVGAVNCFQDITERKRSEEAAQRLAAIIESSDDAIVGKDLDGIITSWNGGAERIFGYLAEEVIGRPITILIPADLQKEEETIIERIRRGQRVEHYETVRQRKDRRLIDVSLSISPVRSAQGEVTGSSKIARDITERKRSEALIVTLAREAEHRTKNILSTVQATVRRSHSDTSDDLKQLIEGRISAAGPPIRTRASPSPL